LDGTPRVELLAAGRAEVEEVERYGGRIVASEARAVPRDGDGFEVELADHTVRARRMNVATGLRDDLPDMPGLREHWARAVLHCLYHHSREVRDRRSAGSQRQCQTLLVRQWADDAVFFAEVLDDVGHAELTMHSGRIVDGKASGLAVEDDELRGVRLVDGTVVARPALFVPARFVPNNALLTGLDCERDDNGWVRVDPSGLTSAWVCGRPAMRRTSAPRRRPGRRQRSR